MDNDSYLLQGGFNLLPIHNSQPFRQSQAHCQDHDNRCYVVARLLMQNGKCNKELDRFEIAVQANKTSNMPSMLKLKSIITEQILKNDIIF